MLSQADVEQLEDTYPSLQDVYPLSPLQQGLLFHSLLEPDSAAYFEQLRVTLNGRFDAHAFEAAWSGVVARHDILRTAFVHQSGADPLQVVLRDVQLPWSLHDWRDLNHEQQQSKLDAFLEQDRSKGFELDQAPLMRISIVRLRDDEYLMVWSHHHLLLDGWSLSLIHI